MGSCGDNSWPPCPLSGGVKRELYPPRWHTVAKSSHKFFLKKYKSAILKYSSYSRRGGTRTEMGNHSRQRGELSNTGKKNHLPPHPIIWWEEPQGRRRRKICRRKKIPQSLQNARQKVRFCGTDKYPLGSRVRSSSIFSLVTYARYPSIILINYTVSWISLKNQALARQPISESIPCRDWSKAYWNQWTYSLISMGFV